MSEGDGNLRVVYRHERVPRMFVELDDDVRLKGAPLNYNLFHYAKGEGFVDYPSDEEPHERGGRTVALIVNADREVLATGVATCSMSDAFCYRTGRRIARGRAMKKLRRQVIGDRFARRLQPVDEVVGG